MLRPKFTPLEVVRCGSSMLDLAVLHRTVLEARLPSGCLDGLKADLAQLRADHENVVAVQDVKMSASRGQDAALKAGANLISAVRDSVRCNFPNDAEMKRLFGIGRPVREGVVESVAAGLQTILEAATQKPDSVRAAGILPEDLERVRTTRTELVGIDTKQESKKLTAKQATAKRIATQLRVEAAMNRIYGAARMVFLDKPDVMAQFEAAYPTPRNHKGKKIDEKPKVQVPA